MIDPQVQVLLEELMFTVSELDANLDYILQLLKGQNIERPILTDGPKIVICKCGYRIAMLFSKQAAYFAARHQSVCTEQTTIIELVRPGHSS